VIGERYLLTSKAPSPLMADAAAINAPVEAISKVYPVGCCIHRRAGADAAGRAGLIVDDNRLAPFLVQLLGDDAGQHIRAAARREWHNHPDRTVRVYVGPGRQCGKRASECDQKCAKQHDNVPGRELRFGHVINRSRTRAPPHPSALMCVALHDCQGSPTIAKCRRFL